MVPPVLALLAFLLALAGHLDIRAAKAELAHWQQQAALMLERHPALRAHVNEALGHLRVDTPRSAGELVATRAPLLFFAGWAWFFAVPWMLRAG